MQFGILISSFALLVDQLPVGTAYLWTALVLFYLQNFNSSIKGQAEVSPTESISHLIGLGEVVYL